MNSDYDEKAEDAVDYEDIDEQYEGPEIQPTTEEDHLLPRKEYYYSEVSEAAIKQPPNLFDDENYDEDEEAEEPQLMENAQPGYIFVRFEFHNGCVHAIVFPLKV